MFKMYQCATFCCSIKILWIFCHYLTLALLYSPTPPPCPTSVTLSTNRPSPLSREPNVKAYKHVFAKKYCIFLTNARILCVLWCTFKLKHLEFKSSQLEMGSCINIVILTQNWVTIMQKCVFVQLAKESSCIDYFLF